MAYRKGPMVVYMLNPVASGVARIQEQRNGIATFSDQKSRRAEKAVMSGAFNVNFRAFSSFSYYLPPPKLLNDLARIPRPVPDRTEAATPVFFSWLRQSQLFMVMLILWFII